MHASDMGIMTESLNNTSWLPNNRKPLVLGLLLIICIAVTFLAEFHLHVDIVYTHIFYILIIITGVWYEKKALYAALFLGLIHVSTDYALKGYFSIAPLIRSAIFFIVAYTVGSLAVHRRKSESQRITIEQQDILMKEIQHRVKNNLNILSSLLSIEGENMIDPGARKVFLDAQSRINSMAYIYERSYNSDDMNSVNLGKYIRDLTESIYGTLSINPDDIIVTAKLSEATIDSKRAVSLGLIINELITNSMKYAYPGGGGEILIGLENDGKFITLTVSDRGSGLPRDSMPKQRIPWVSGW